jgi:hypothetical protein
MIMNMVALIKAAREAAKGAGEAEPEEIDEVEVEYQVDRPLKN